MIKTRYTLAKNTNAQNQILILNMSFVKKEKDKKWNQVEFYFYEMYQ